MSTVRRLPGRPQAVGRPAHEGRQLLVDDLDDLLAGRERLEDLAPDGAFADTLDEERTTLTLTSASSSARRTSRSASAMLSSLRRPKPRSRLKMSFSRSLSPWNMDSPTKRKLGNYP